MTTFTLLVWLAALGMFVWLSSKLFPYLWQAARRGNDDGAIGLAVYTLVWLIIVFGLTSALIFDIFGVALSDGSIFESMSWWVPVLMFGVNPAIGVTRASILLIAGLVALGMCSLVALAYNYFRGRKYYYYGTNKSIFNFGSTGSFIVQGIGFLASVLGIISFYLDYFN